MSNRRIEMYHYRQALVRMRLGESDRAIAKTGIMGRNKVAALRKLARSCAWLDPAQPLPSEAELDQRLGGEIRAPSPSLVTDYQDEVEQWHESGIAGTTIYRALIRKYGFTGSYSSVRRFLQQHKQSTPAVTSVIDFEPGEAAQVDFGKGPEIIDVTTGEVIKTWIFVMVLCWSRHLYAEIVRDQSTETWLACHRHAFEWFGGVPKRVIIDYVPGHIIDIMCPSRLCGC